MRRAWQNSPWVDERSGLRFSRCFAVASRSGSGGVRTSRLDLLQSLGVGNDVTQQLVQIIVAVEFGQQVAQTLASFEQTPQRSDLLDHLDRVEVIDVFEV